ncbi:MAG: ShlB/FhaC/HecB family hemolysin secretion/activation protein [Nitrospinota bacterium]
MDSLWAQQSAQNPQFSEPGLSERSLRQSQPFYQPPLEEQAPEIVVPDSRKPVDPQKGPKFFVKKIAVEGSTLFPKEELEALVKLDEKGKEITFGLLLLLAQELTSYYVSQGYFLSRAYVPAQKLQDGIVKINIAEGKINNIQVTGNKSLDSEEIANRMTRVKEEGILREQTLERTLLELNDLMGVTVKSLLKPGELPGTSDLVLEVKESPAYSFAFDMDNFGSEFTGRVHYNFSASAGNLLKLGDQFSLRVIQSDFTQSLVAPSFLYPINNYGTTVKFSYSHSKQSLGKGRNIIPLEIKGSSDSYVFEVNHPLYRSRLGQLNLKAGYSMRESRNFRLGSIDSRDNLRGIHVSLGGNYTDRFLGRTFAELRFNQGVSESNENLNLASRIDARGDVFRAKLNFTRFQGTGVLGSYFIIKGNGQISGSRVLSSNLFSIGGFGTVRGFPISEYSGSNGYSVGLEYVLPFPSNAPVAKGEKLKWKDFLSFNAFIEGGRIQILDQVPDDLNRAISGGGFGMKMNIPKTKPWGPSYNFALSFGIPFQGPPPTDGTSGILYASGGINYY